MHHRRALGRVQTILRLPDDGVFNVQRHRRIGDHEWTPWLIDRSHLAVVRFDRHDLPLADELCPGRVHELRFGRVNLLNGLKWQSKNRCEIDLNQHGLSSRRQGTGPVGNREGSRPPPGPVNGPFVATIFYITPEPKPSARFSSRALTGVAAGWAAC